ncbi:hypothetical protein [Hydrogenimonas sp.]|nr:hypothetical protein [Hydrogenimonas sp.]
MPAEFLWKITAIALIAAGLIATLVWELRKPRRDPNDNPDTKRMNDMLKD